MGKRKRYSDWIFRNADSVLDEHFLYVEVGMVEIWYIDGDKETLELIAKKGKKHQLLL